jgi:hypothetical protein
MSAQNYIKKLIIKYLETEEVHPSRLATLVWIVIRW